MEPTEEGVQRALTERVVGLEVLSDPGTVARSLDCLVDWFGVATSSAAAPVVGLLRDLAPGSPPGADGVPDPGRVAVLGDERSFEPLWAARINGTAGHAQDFDDTHATSLVHVSSAVLPALLSALADDDVDGRELLAAYVVGIWTCEVLAAGAGQRLLRSGLHPTATLGAIAAAAATARLLRLDLDRCETALGLAASTSYGTLANFGTMAKPLQAGAAAASGLLATRLAQQGVTAGRWSVRRADNAGPVVRTLLSAADQVASAIADPASVRDGVANVAHKPYAACLLTHAAIDGAIELADRVAAHGGAAGIRGVQLRAGRETIAAAGIPRPMTGYEGKFSLAYCVATALIRGSVPVSAFAEDFGADPRVTELLPRVSVDEARDLDGFEVHIEVAHTDGEVSRIRPTSARGQPTQPLAPDELDAKLMDNVTDVLGASAATALLDQLRSLPEAASARGWAAKVWGSARERTAEVT